MRLRAPSVCAVLLLLTACPTDAVEAGDTDDGSTTGGASSTQGTTLSPTTGMPSTAGPTTAGSTTTQGQDPSSTDGDDVTDTSSSDSAADTTTGGETPSTGAVAAPELEVTVEGVVQASGDTIELPGNIDVGMSGVAVQLTLSNVGTDTLDLNEATLLGGAENHFVLNTAMMAASLEPDESTTVDLAFAPINGGAKSIAFVLETNDDDDPEYVLDVTANTTPNVWRSLSPGPGPAARFNAAMAPLGGGDVLLYGGRDAKGAALSDTWIFSVESEAWTEVATTASPGARFSHGLAPAGDGLAVFYGGTPTPGNGGDPQSDTWHFDAAAMDWMQVEPELTPPTLINHGMTGFDGGALLYGGITGPTQGDLSDELWLYDAPTTTWLRLFIDGPPALHSPAMAFNGVDTMTLAGGVVTPGGAVQDAVFTVDFSDKSISENTATLPAARFGQELVYLSEDLGITFGGRAGQGLVGLDGTLSYQLSTDVWTDLAPALQPAPRHNYAVAGVGEHKLILFGGVQSDLSGVTYGDVWEYVGPQP